MASVTAKIISGNEIFRSLFMIAPDLIDAQGNGFVFGGILAFKDHYRDTVDQEDDILPVPKMAVVPVKFLGDLVNVAPLIR